MSIVLNSKTYNFGGYDPNSVSQYIERSAGVPSGFSLLTSRVQGAGQGATDQKVRWWLNIPIIATVDSECACVGQVLRTYKVRIEVEEPAGSLAAERTDLQARIVALVSTTEFSASITNLLQPSS